MANYYYKGKSGSGYVEGYLQAGSVVEAANILERNKIVVLEIKEQVKSKTNVEANSVDTFTIKEKKDFFNSFYFQYKSGVAITEVFNVIATSASSQNVKALACKISAKIQAGCSLEDAMAKYSQYIGHVYCALVATGEKTGELEDVLLGIIKNINQLEKIRTSIIKKSTYPLIILCMAIAAALFFNMFVFKIFNMSDSAIGVSDFIFELVFCVLKIAVIFVIGFVVIINLIKNKNFMYSLLNKITNVPFLKPILDNYYFYNFFYIFSLSYKAGMSLLQSMQLAMSVVNSNEINAKITKAYSMIEKGCEIKTAFEVANVFSEFAISQISAGEKSGKIDEMAGSVANDYENGLNIQIDTLMKFVEPLLLVAVGLVVAITAGSFFWQYYSKLFSML